MDSYRKKQQRNYDIGGIRCKCCNKFFGKDKYKLNKQARKQLKEEDAREFNKILTVKSREEIINEITDEDTKVFWEERQKKIYKEYLMSQQWWNV